MIRRFIIYGFLGLSAEIFWTGFGSLLRGDIKLTGYTYIWMFFIYGLAVFLEPMHDMIRSWPLLLRGGVYMLILFSIEYSSGWLLRDIIGVCPWNYGNGPLSINGLIRLDFAPVWFCCGLAFERVHDAVDRLFFLLGVHS